MPTHELLTLLSELNLPPGDYAVFGSGPLLVRGIIADSNDLDVLCRGDAWNRVKSIGKLMHDDTYDVDIISMHGERLTFGTKWGIGEFVVDELIDGAELIDGIPFVQLEHVVTYKHARNSEKDQRHIRAIQQTGLLND